MKTEEITKIPIQDIIDNIWLKYFSKWAGEYWLYDSNWKTSWRWFNTNKNIVKDFVGKDRPDWDNFWFIKQHFSFTDQQTFKRFEDNYWITNNIKNEKKSIQQIRSWLNELWDKQQEYIKSRWIDYEKIKDIVKEYAWWIGCLVYENNSPKGLTARTLSSDHNHRFTALSWYSTKWVYLNEIDFTKKYLIVVEWLIDFLTLRQYDSNVVWLKSAESGYEEIEKYSKKFDIILIPDQDEAGKKGLEKVKFKHKVFDLSKYWTHKDINDFHKDYNDKWILVAILEDSKEILPITNTFQKLYERQKILKERWKLGFDWPLEIYNDTSWVIPGKVYTVWAYSNVGKSKFSYFNAQYFIKKWYKVLFINNEVDEINCLMNIIQAMDDKSQWDMIKWHKTNEDNYKNLIIRDDIYTIDWVMECIENVKPDIVFIDFVQNIDWKGWSDYEKNANIAKSIQRTAIKNECVIFALSQLSNSMWRDVNNWSMDFVSLKWSWEYFASSDVIFILFKWEPGEMWLKVAKNKFWYNGAQYMMEVNYANNQFKVKTKEENPF